MSTFEIITSVVDGRRRRQLSSSVVAGRCLSSLSLSPSCSLARLVNTTNKYDHDKYHRDDDDDDENRNSDYDQQHRLDKTTPSNSKAITTAPATTTTKTKKMPNHHHNHADRHANVTSNVTKARMMDDGPSQSKQLVKLERANSQHKPICSALLSALFISSPDEQAFLSFCCLSSLLVRSKIRIGNCRVGKTNRETNELNRSSGDGNSAARARAVDSRTDAARWPIEIGARAQRRTTLACGSGNNEHVAESSTCGRSAGGRDQGKNKQNKQNELGLISMVSLLIILAHICQIVLPPSTSGRLVSVALAQNVGKHNNASNRDNSNHANVSHETLTSGDYAASESQARERAGAMPALFRRTRATGDYDQQANAQESWRARSESMRDMRNAHAKNEKLPVNVSEVFEVLLKRRPYSKYWSVEQKWDDLFRRAMAVQGPIREMMMKSFLRDVGYYADISISEECEKDLKYIQNYLRTSTNFRWMAHMFDSTGKSEPGMLTGNLANLGHPVQCIKVRAPARPSNHTLDERFFEQQTDLLGERFRGKYCVASMRPVLPARSKNVPVSRFSELMDSSLLSNISYTGEPKEQLKQRARQMSVPAEARSLIDREHLRLDQVPFESELYEYLILQRNFMYTLPRFMGVCYPSSCSRDDVRISLQKTLDEQHQVVDVEFECEQEEMNAWDWFIAPRLICYVLLTFIGGLVFFASLIRYVLLSKVRIRRDKLSPESGMRTLLNALDMFSMDKCAGILFIKTKQATSQVDWTRVENNRSSTIDALKGLLILILVYSQITVLGCLPLPFMWSKWSDAMFPFFRSLITQPFINLSIWSEAFYMISAYLIALKLFENHRPKLIKTNGPSMSANSDRNSCSLPDFFSYASKRYVRLVLPMLAFILCNYIWPRLSNGFVMQDQTSKLMKPCDSFGWTNFLMFHNYNQLNETCLWPSHASASFFQLHLLSYPIIVLLIMVLHSQFNQEKNRAYEERKSRRSEMTVRILTGLAFGLISLLAVFGLVYPALQASKRSLVVPFLIDYIDFDNYARVLEWTVLPTYNHITSYMFGIALAFIVIKRKASKEMQQLETSHWYGGGGGGGSGAANALGHYSQRRASVESARSSSTQELHHDGLTFKQALTLGNSRSINQTKLTESGKHFNISSCSSETSSNQNSKPPYGEIDDENNEDDASLSRRRRSPVCCFLVSLVSLLVCLFALTASWFWNGLGQPMNEEQTFWYIILTKLTFCTAFAHLFHKHFATRRNSSDPWMLTRFLVPIGRMSLSVFYVSWLVIWFDLLSSLHQWHPSHYFVCEKYSEIIFITLIVAMFVYGAFEGIVKRIQYTNRLTNVKHDIRLRMSSVANGGNLEFSAYRASYLATSKVKPFESFFNPCDKPTLNELASEYKLDQEPSRSTSGEKKLAHLQHFNETGGPLSRSASFCTIDGGELLYRQVAHAKSAYLSSASMGTGSGELAQVSPTSGINLSPSDRYKLNAELRANYSFASIGLYEFAGATGDLTHLTVGSPNDPQENHPRR